MKRVLAAASVAGLFLTGVVVGLFGAHLFYAHRLERFGGPPGVVERLYQERLDRRLRLTPEQRERVEEILRASHGEARALRDAMRPRVEAILERAGDRISEILDPQQRRRFEELRSERRRWAEIFLLGPADGHHPRYERHHDGRGPGPGPWRRGPGRRGPYGPPDVGPPDDRPPPEGPSADRPTAVGTPADGSSPGQPPQDTPPPQGPPSDGPP